MGTNKNWIDYTKIPAPKCICGECDDPNSEYYPQRFQCTQCQREIPWCLGAADDYEDLCDDCWGNVVKAEAQDRWEEEAAAQDLAVEFNKIVRDQENEGIQPPT